MSADHSLALQKALIDGMKADAGISGSAIGQNVFDYIEAKQQRPYIGYGQDGVTPYNPQCVSGGEISGSIHILTQAQYGRAQCKQLTKLVFEYLSAIGEATPKPALEEGTLIAFLVRNSVVFQDPDEQGAWQGTVTFDALTGQDP